MYCTLPCKNFKTENLYVRFVDENDYKAFFEFCSDYEVCKYLTFIPYKNPSEAKEAILNMVRAYLEGTDINYSVIYNKKVIGSISLEFDKDKNEAELGYIFNKKYWHKGLAYEAINNLLITCKYYYKLDRVIAKCVEENDNSVHLLNVLKFNKIDIIKNYPLKDNMTYDILVFELKM